MKTTVLVLALAVLVCGCVEQQSGPGLAELVGQCRNFTNQSDVDMCLLELSLERREPRLCEEIGSTGLGVSCHLQYMDLAAELQDPSLCEKLTYKSSRDECFSVVAVSAGDISVCERIIVTGQSSNEVFFRDRCFTALAGNVVDLGVCESLPVQSAKDICLRNIAVERMDVGLCERISSGQQRDSCYGGVAVATGNALLCENIGRVVEKVFLTDDGGFEVVSVVDNQVGRDSCYLGVARKKGDSLLCGEIVSSEIQNQCLEET